jgi:branched-subunit amino acid ABC-type transport system permease component
VVTIVNQLFAGLSLAVVLFFAAAGLNLVWGVLGVMNFATGSIYMLGAYLASSIMGKVSVSIAMFAAALILVPVAVGAAGGATEVLLLRRTYVREDENQQFMLTLAISYVIAGVILLTYGTHFRSVGLPHVFDGSWTPFGTTLPRYTVVTIAIGIVVTASIYLLLYRTRLGLLIRAAASDRGMLSALGVDVQRLYTFVFALGIGLGALGGALIAPVYAVTTNLDTVILVPAFIVVVTGGMGSMSGALVASLVIGLLQSFVTLRTPTLAQVTPYLVMIIVLLYRGIAASPHGFRIRLPRLRMQGS